jgi:hypothetical protein
LWDLGENDERRIIGMKLNDHLFSEEEIKEFKEKHNLTEKIASKTEIEGARSRDYEKNTQRLKDKVEYLSYR